MEHSVALPEDALLHRASVGHFLRGEEGKKLVRTSAAFLSLSFAPAGSTVMVSARDLIEFARAHINDGVGANGNRILSAKSARAMRLATVNNRGKTYTLTDAVGVGWLLSGDGLIHHAGGGAGIVSVLYVHPEKQFAAAILTNASHGMLLTNELMQPWLAHLETMRPFGFVDISIPAGPVEVASSRYVGRFEDVMNSFEVTEAGSGLEISKQPKFACDDGVSLDAARPARLIPLGSDEFYLESGEAANPLFNGHRVFSFSNPGSDGCMRHLGNVLRLYKRTL
jgi:CubicO group peptidase (beta-lactamase class C family)